MLPGLLAFPSASGGGGASASFTTIQPDAGTSPVATGPTDTLTLTSTDNSLVITGNSGTDTIAFTAGSNLALLGGRSAGQTLNGGDGTGLNLTLKSNTAGDGKILFGASSAYDEGNLRFGVGTASPTYRGHFEATADNYSHGVAISHALGGANALTRLYQDLNGTFSIANPNQLTTTLVSTPFGQVALADGVFTAGASVCFRTHADYLARHTLALVKKASQTGKLLLFTDTDASTELLSVDVAGVTKSSSGNEQAATLGTAAATNYLKHTLSDGSTRWIPLVTTPN